MMVQDKYRLSFDGQVNAAINNEFPYYVFEMKYDIDVETLEKAVNKAVIYHPIFKMKLKKEKRLYYLVPDSSSIKITISDWKKDITYGTREYNGYLWIIAAGGKRMMFTCAHCLCDGMGAISFLKKVISIYLMDKGLVSNKTEIDISEDYIQKKIEDSFEKNARTGIKAPYKVRKTAKASRVSSKVFEKNSEKTIKYRFIIPKNEIKDLLNRQKQLRLR